MKPEEENRNTIIDQLTGEKRAEVESESRIGQNSALTKIWEAAGFISTMNRFNSSEAWRVVNQSIEKQNTRKIRLQKAVYAMSGVAAAIVLMLGLAVFTGQFSITENKMRLTTAYGSRTELTLPDGSQVKLNSGSNIDYHYNRVTGIRKVNFEGEAFFDVAKSKKPFVIQTPKGMQLKVLGTSFNLSAYPEDKYFEATLIEGKIELSNANGEKLILKPGQIGSYDPLSSHLVYKQGDPSLEMGWLDNKIYLDNTSLSRLSRQLERRFDVQISMIPASIGQEIHYTGVLGEQTITDVLEALTELNGEIRYQMKGKNITIMNK
ncbi:FecR family protein [Sunxiuqinia indica]|uniref:FecR family protein n=1 Tax=Sunxiuqinia indica TaxID=2692584 RepID=UPI001359547A|nr:FecR domain-containing protein [Sunxiuqinia indica]